MRILQPCPLCEALDGREHLAHGGELCGRCGYSFCFDDSNELVWWQTTSKSHPDGVYAANGVMLKIPARGKRLQ